MAWRSYYRIDSPNGQVIINEGIETFLMQRMIQVAYKTMAGIFTSKTQEDIKALASVGERRKRKMKLFYRAQAPSGFIRKQ
jgi:hypothetical protein